MWSSTLLINWKQRFFVPTEEEPGIAILATLLEQFPVIATADEAANSDRPSDLTLPSSNATQRVDLENWIIEPAEIRISDDSAEPEPIAIRESESVSETTHIPPIAHQAIAAAMLLTQPPDYRTAAIQIGFNFAESEA